MKKSKYSSFNHKVKFISRVISWTLFVLLLIVASLLLYYFVSTRVIGKNNSNYKPAFGLYTIVSPSMEPNLKIYDVIVNVKVNNPNKIKVGDVITFISTSTISKGMTITHRVISIKEDENGKSFQTQGDNNLSPDASLVPYENVLGKVLIKIPQLGRIQSFLTTKGGWLIVVVIPAFLIILSDIMKLFKLKEVEKDVDALTSIEEAFQEDEKTKQRLIEQRLASRYKPKRNSNEVDPFYKHSVVISVGNKNKNDLPKLKPENDEQLPKKRQRTRKKKKTNDN